jgi:acyl-CoA thioester hydrolase
LGRERVEDRGAIGREAPEGRDRYRHFLEIPTRWMDNDVYGHVNNVVYYSYFDTVVNGYLISSGSLDIERSPIIGLVVETQCRFFKPIAFPDTVHAGLRVARLGNSSVRYEIGLFRNDESASAAQGHFVHVYVDRETRRPAGLPQQMREALEKIRTGT